MVQNNSGGIVAFGLKYRRLVILVVTVLVAFGIYALKEMDKNEFPGFTVREGLVVAVCPGSDATQMENEVLKPLEDFIFSYKEVDKTSTHSRCTSGMAIVFVELDDNIDNTDAFWNKFQLGLQAEKTKLPSSVLALEALTDFGDTSALLISLSSKDKTYRELQDMLTDLRDRLRPIESVGQMSVYGEQKEQITITVDNEKLANYGIKANTLALTMLTQGFNTTGGEIKGEKYTSPIYVSRSVGSERDVANMIVLSMPGGQVVRVSDIATVKREYPDPTSYITNNGDKSLLLSVSMKEGNNIVAMGREVQKVLDDFEQTLPSDVELFKITDQPTVVNSSVMDFLKELLIAIVAVVVVIMILLPMRVALIAAATIPVTIFISLGFFYALGIELNTVTLACLIVSLGMIVDNSVVIIDNYVELISEGMDHKRAAYQSAVEFLKAIFSATCAISITFFPFLLTLTGMFRDFMNDFPWAITIILFTSLVIAEILVPFLQYKLIKKPIYKIEQEAVASGKKKFSFFVMLQKGYNRLADLCFNWPKTTLVVGLVSVIIGGWAFMKRPMKLMPIAERNQFAVEIYLPTGTPLARTDMVADSLARILRHDDRVVSVAIFHGCSSPRFQTTYAPQVGGSNFAQFIVNTVSQDATIDVLNEYTPKFENYFPEAFCRFKQLSYSNADYPIEVRISGSDFKELQAVADTVLQTMREFPGLRLVRPNTSTPQVGAMVEANATQMQRLGISNLFLEGTLALRYSSGVPLATVWEGDYGLPVVLKSEKSDSSRISELMAEQIPVLEIAHAPVRQFASVNPVWDYGLIGHYNGVPTITLIAETQRNLYPMTLTDNLIKAIDKIEMPAGVTIEYGGDYENTDEILPQILMALAIAVVIIFFIILLHYKQVSVSMILLVSLLVCVPGAALGLFVMSEPISLTCTLGVISLMGILVRNAIIMIDYAEQLQADDKYDNRAASLESAKRRMRPIFLTSAAATMGVLPMVLSGSALWKPMGTVIFFGTPLTMIFTLTVIPVMLWKFSGKTSIDPPFGCPTPEIPPVSGRTAPAGQNGISETNVMTGSASDNVDSSRNQSKGNGMMKTTAIALMMLFAGGLHIYAQQTLQAPEILTLEQCRELAVQNNASVKIARGNVEAAQAVKDEAFTKYFPTVDATGLAFGTNRPVVNYDVLDVFNLQMIKKGVGASVVAVQPVFAGGRIVNGNRLASVGVEVGKLQQQNAADKARLTAEQYYWQLYTLKSKKQTLETVIAMVDTLQYQVGVAVDAGVVMRNDYLKVQLKNNDLHSLLVDLDNGIMLSKKLLAQYVGMDGIPVDIAEPELPADVPEVPYDIYIEPRQALVGTPDYQLLDRQVEAARIERRMTVGANMPTVGVGAGYFYDDIINQGNHFGAIFVSVNIPISGWWGGSHAIKKKKIQETNAILEKENLSQMLELGMTNAWDDLTAAHRKMMIAHESIAQSTENLRLNRDYYDAGISTITDLLDAQTLYQQSLDQYAEAYGNFCLKRATYLNATNQ